MQHNLDGQFATNADYGNVGGAGDNTSVAAAGNAIPAQYSGEETFGNAYGGLSPKMVGQRNSAPSSGTSESTIDDIRGGQGNASGGKSVDAVTEVEHIPFDTYVMDEAFERMPALPMTEQVASKRYPITNAEINFDGQKMHNPLTKKGKDVMASMQSEYGESKGKKVFYASRNKGTIKGVD